MKNSLPYFAVGQVVKGFGRGSKSLGCPTANFPPEVVSNLPSALPNGIYFGWAQVENGPVLPSVSSLGTNPYFNNSSTSLETHIMHDFESDFYGSILKVCLLGYIRNEKNFNSIDELKSAIEEDISHANKELVRPEFKSFSTHPFFSPSSTSPTNSHL